MLLVLAAAAIRVLILVSSPAPKIDVFHVQTEGAKGLLERHNVYAMAPARPAAGQGEAREFYGYQYPPTAFYPVVASWVLFKDVRAMWVVCDLVAALLLYLVARYRQLLVLTYLFLPRTLFVLESAWMEPLIVAAMAGLTLALASARGPFLTGLLMAVWFGSKQYMVLALPFFLKLRRAGAKAWAVAIAAGVILALPFVLWDWRALWEKVGLFILQSPGRPDALSIYGALLRNGVELPGWIGLILWLAAMVWLTWKMPRTLSGWLFSTATLWVVFFLVGKWAFMNYFHLVIGALFLAVAAHPLNKGEDTG
jgi:hypothetical protein